MKNDFSPEERTLNLSAPESLGRVDDGGLEVDDFGFVTDFERLEEREGEEALDLLLDLEE